MFIISTVQFIKTLSSEYPTNPPRTSLAKMVKFSFITKLTLLNLHFIHLSNSVPTSTFSEDSQTSFKFKFFTVAF